MSTGSGDRPWDLLTNWVGEALVFHADGRALGRVRSGRPPESSVDPMAPEVVAFQGMVQDGLGERGRAVSAVYGERVLSLVPGTIVHVATVSRGRPDPALRSSMEEAVARIEAVWGSRIRSWSGAPGELEGLATELAPVVGRTADRGPGEVDDPLNVRGVFPVSAVDFEGGHLRLKVAVFSSGFLVLRGGYAELSFNRDALRVQGSAPAQALSDEGTLRVGTIPPGEASTVACLLEPLVPGRHLLEGTLTFFDDANNPRHMEIPRREADVLFPALGLETTPRKPVQGSDEAARGWRYPASLGGLDVVRTVRTVLGTRGLELSTGEEVEGTPPAWMIEGRAMADRSPLWVTMTVTGGDVRRIGMRVASTNPVVTAGVLAELRALLVGEFFRRWRGQVILEEEGLRARAGPGALPETDIDMYVPWR